MTGVVVWITGRPGAGKSRFAKRTLEALRAAGGRSACRLDGDELREALRPQPGYEPEERDAFYATLANLAALLANQGLVVLVAATAHRSAFRERARERAPAYLEVFVDIGQAELERRDPKGLYRAIREGRLSGVPGADVAYEAPERPDVRATGGDDSAALEKLIALLL